MLGEWGSGQEAFFGNPSSAANVQPPTWTTALAGP